MAKLTIDERIKKLTALKDRQDKIAAAKKQKTDAEKLLKELRKKK